MYLEFIHKPARDMELISCSLSDSKQSTGFASSAMIWVGFKIEI